MSKIKYALWFVSLALLLGAVAACSSDEGGAPADDDTQPQGLRATIPSVGALDGAFAQAAGVTGGRQGSQAPRVFGSVGAMPDDAGIDRDLDGTLTGRNASIEADLNGAGSPQTIQAFIVAGNATFLAWQGDGSCRLAWRQGTQGGYLETACGAAGGLYCSFPTGAANPLCTHCDAERCATCATNGTEVSCLPIVEPEPEPEPEPTDVGVPEDTDTPPVDTGTVDTGTVDSGSDTGSGEDVIIPPFDSGGEPEPIVAACDEDCLATSSEECCTECNCFGAGLCRPVCGGGYEWDCALQCCYNYDLLRCDCPTGSVWNAEGACCGPASGGCFGE